MVINIKTNPLTRIEATGERSHGGAFNSYTVIEREKIETVEGQTRTVPERIIETIDFQAGPVQEHGVNGVQIEDLISIAMHRLNCFQGGSHPHELNDRAVGYLKLALDALDQRTAERRARGVEGTSKR